jgi:hypothetical protein
MLEQWAAGDGGASEATNYQELGRKRWTFGTNMLDIQESTSTLKIYFYT